MLRYINLIIAIIIFICNIPLLLINYTIISSEGGPMGFGLLAYPFIFIANLFCVPALISCMPKNSSKVLFFVTNVLGVLYCIFFAFLLSTQPSLD